MTLTLGEKYHSEGEREDKTYIVDPIFNGTLNFNAILQAVCTAIKHPLDLLKLCWDNTATFALWKEHREQNIKTALYYKEYSKSVWSGNSSWSPHM